MPFNANRVFYESPIRLTAAELGPRLITADVTIPSTPFSFQGASDIWAALNILEYLTTSLTGANNDLNIMARLPGSTDYTVEFKDPSANSAALSVKVHAYLKTALTGNNNDLVFHAVAEGAAGEAITIRYLDPSANDAVESVTVVGSAITFNLSTDGSGVITSTGDTLKATLLASAPASALVTAADAASNDGSGVVIALAATALAGRAIIVHLATGSGGAITSTAALVAAAINADTLAGALVVAENAAANTGAGVVTALAQTALAGPAGSSPTLDVKLRDGIVGASGNLLKNHTSFTQTNTTGTELKVMTSVAPIGEWVLDIGGTSSPCFAVSIDVYVRS